MNASQDLPEFTNAVRRRLRCSSCNSELRDSGASVQCKGCHHVFHRTARGVLDLRPRPSKEVDVRFRVDGALAKYAGMRFGPLQPNASAAVDFGDEPVPFHMTKELMSYFPRAAEPGRLMLDLGCGNGVHRRISDLAGFEWVGLDADETSAATIVGDAHALPLADESVDFVLSVASLHLVRHPHVVLKEVRRVLRGGGAFLGTVAFLEPYHDGGYYHHTHLGVLNSLDNAGFEVLCVAPSAEWTSLRAQAQMALFPRMPVFASRALMLPIEFLHRSWWRMGRAATRNENASEEARVRNLTAAFAFVAYARA